MLHPQNGKRQSYQDVARDVNAQENRFAAALNDKHELHVVVLIRIDFDLRFDYLPSLVAIGRHRPSKLIGIELHVFVCQKRPKDNRTHLRVVRPVSKITDALRFLMARKQTCDLSIELNQTVDFVTSSKSVVKMRVVEK